MESKDIPSQMHALLGTLYFLRWVTTRKLVNCQPQAPYTHISPSVAEREFSSPRLFNKNLK